jgi:hypothetical protein
LVGTDAFGVFVSTEWLEYISIVQVVGKSEKQILQLIIQSIWKVWNQAWLQNNDDIDPTSCYHTQIQDYQHKIDLKTIYECFTLMGRSNPLLLSNVDIHLQDTCENVACLVAMYCGTLQAEIDTFDPDLWTHANSNFRTQSLVM